MSQRARPAEWRYAEGVARFADQPVNTWRLPSFRAEHFPGSGPYPWLDRADALETIAARNLTAEEAKQCVNWVRDGYIIIRGLIDADTLSTVWTNYQRAIDRGRIVLAPEPAGPDDPYPGRFLNPHRKVGAFCRIAKHAGLLQWIRLLLEREPRVLQTIASHKGSQQPAHSDSIHMTTYPLGYLAAAWIAFEDIHADSGPLVYYPGSHRWPYLFSHNVSISESEFQREGYRTYQAKYEPKICELIAEGGIEPHYFEAQRGDVLIWHANLVHGGSPRHDLQRSRRAVVAHYFGKGAFVYHDLAATRSKQQYVSTCLLRGWKKGCGEPQPLFVFAG